MFHFLFSVIGSYPVKSQYCTNFLRLVKLVYAFLSLTTFVDDTSYPPPTTHAWNLTLEGWTFPFPSFPFAPILLNKIVRSLQSMMKRPSCHLLSIKTKHPPCGVLMVWFGFWCRFWCTPCAKVALLRYAAFVLVWLCGTP